MTELLSYLIALGPLAAIAIIVPIAGIGFAPWLWRHPERWLFLAILVLSFGPVAGDPSGDGSVFRQVSWGGLFVAVTALLAFDRRKGELPLHELLPAGFVLLLLAIAFSVLWSPEHFISFKRAIQCLGVVLIGMLSARLAMRGDTLQMQLRKPALILLLFGLCIAVVAPSVAFDTDHALRGISPHKNVWGQFSLIVGLVLLFACLDSQRFSWVSAGGLALAMISLALSRSTTSLLAFALIAGTTATWLMAVRLGAIGKIVLVAFLAGAALAFHLYLVFTGVWPLDALYDLVFQVTGKEQTLTGRKFLWQLMFLEIAKHPWLGTGYGGFWTNTSGAASILVSKLNWGPPVQAHSGYIDIVNELGIVGMALFVGVLVTHLRNIALLLKHTRSYAAMFHASLIFAVLLINYAETSLLRTTHILWIATCVSILEVHVLTRELRQRETRKDLTNERNTIRRATYGQS